MASIMLITGFFLIALYLVALAAMAFGFHKLQRRIAAPAAPLPDAALPSVAIIISARNEQDNLPGLLRALNRLDYPGEKLEICIIDDRSQDRSREILRRAQAENPCITVLHIDDLIPDTAPKKRAISMGIAATRGEIILLTDADCTPPPTWVRAMAAHYRDRRTVMVPGYSSYRFDHPAPALVRGMLALEYFTHSALAAASTPLHHPITACGCNLSYRRSTWEQVGGFGELNQWISGDDDLFVHKVAQRYPGRFSYAFSAEARVPQAAPKTFRQFWNQRIRYASKSRQYQPGLITGLVAVYFVNVFVFFGSLSFALSPQLAAGAGIAWLLKAGGEWLFLRRVTRACGEEHLLRWFLPAQLVHPLYVIVFGCLGLFARFQWKEDNYEKKTKPELTYS